MRRYITSILVGLIAAPAIAQPCDPAAPQLSLYDLGIGSYKTFQGGLYSGGTNQRPAAHEAAGTAIAHAISTLDLGGNPSPIGRIVMISIGISNMTQEWRVGANNDPSSFILAFTSKAQALQQQGVVNPAVLVVDGAQGGQDASNWGANPPNIAVAPWSVVLSRLTGPQYNSNPLQVQIACVKAATLGPTTCIAPDGSTLGDAGALAQNFANIARNLKNVFPNIKLVYFVSRSYGGYATGGNREPFAYEQGFGIKWAIDSQIQASGIFGNLNYAGGSAVAPWMSWGAYLWSNGTTPNGLGITWSVNDFVSDHIHPSASGVDKAADAMLNHFLTDTTTRPWFGWQCLRGDVNGDGQYSGSDIAAFVNVLNDPTAVSVTMQCRADANNNGVIDAGDASSLVTAILSAP